MISEENNLFKVLFVCTGNVCRSPMAEGILKKEMSAVRASKISVYSAGIAAHAGAPASREAEHVCSEYGIDISTHKARVVTNEMLRDADILFALATAHYNWILDQGTDFIQKTYFLKEFGHAHDVPQAKDILDPFGSNYEVYLACFMEIRKEIKRIIPSLERLALKKNI